MFVVRRRRCLFTIHHCKVQQRTVAQVTGRKWVFTLLRQLRFYEVGLEFGPLALPKPVTAVIAEFNIRCEETSQ